MPTQRCRVVDDAISTREDAGEVIMIATRAGRCPGIERFVEGAEDVEHGAAERHTGARAYTRHEERVVIDAVVDDTRIAARETVRVFEPLLRGRLQLLRKNEPRHAEGARIAEVAGHGAEPIRVDHCIIIAEDDDFSRGVAHGAVARDVESRALLAYVVYPAMALRHRAHCGAVARGTVHDENFLAIVGKCVECKQAPFQIVQPVARADGDRGAGRRCLHPVFPGQPLLELTKGDRMSRDAFHTVAQQFPIQCPAAKGKGTMTHWPSVPRHQGEQMVVTRRKVERCGELRRVEVDNCCGHLGFGRIRRGFLVGVTRFV